MLTHFKRAHDVSIKSRQLQFSSWENFEEWRSGMEYKTQYKFIEKKNENFKGHTMIIIYEGHRSRKYITRGEGSRTLKTQGSCKINAFCLAVIKVSKFVDGKCRVDFCETHVGHEAELRHLNLTKFERKELASKIALKLLNSHLIRFSMKFENRCLTQH